MFVVFSSHEQLPLQHNEAGGSLCGIIMEISKYNFNGDLVSSQQVRFKGCRLHEACHRTIYPAGIEGLYAFRDNTIFSPDPDISIERSHYDNQRILYDIRLDKLVLEKATPPSQICCNRPTRQQWPWPREYLCWKDVEYMAGHHGGTLGSISVHNSKDLSTLQWTEMSNIRFNLAAPRERFARRESYDMEGVNFIRGDDRFFIVIGTHEIQVWCFEEDLVMAGEEPEYRAERRRRAESRSAKRRLHAEEKHLGSS